MTKNNSDDYISELIDPRPLGIEKILAAWGGMSSETKIQIYRRLKEVDPPSYLFDKVRDKALEDENEYIRYLATKDVLDEKHQKRIIDQESSELIKYSFIESSSSSIFLSEYEDPKNFFSKPHFERLALLHNEEYGGEEIAKCISYAIDELLPEKKISEIEIFELLYEYIEKPEFRARHNEEMSRDGWSEFTKGREIQELWNLTINAPELISYYLIKTLPVESGLSGLDESLIEQWDKPLLNNFLYRHDIGMEELRKRLFFEDDSGDFAQAASTYNFDLEPKEMDKIIDDAFENKSTKKLKDLATVASDLSLVNYKLLDDIIGKALDSSALGTDYEYGQFAEDSFNRKLKELSGWQRKKQILDLRLYYLAKQIKPWNEDDYIYELKEKLDFLEGSIKENTWKTFIELKNKWEKSWNQSEDYLPRIDELDEEDLDLDYDNEDSESGNELSTVKEQTEKIKEMLEGIKEEQDSGLLYNHAFSEIANLINQSHNELTRNIDNQSKEIYRIAETNEQFFAYIIKPIFFGFMVFIIYVIYKIFT